MELPKTWVWVAQFLETRALELVFRPPSPGASAHGCNIELIAGPQLDPTLRGDFASGLLASLTSDNFAALSALASSFLN